MDTQTASLIQTAIDYFQKGHLDRAEMPLQEVLQSQPRNFAALHVLGIIRVVQNRYDDAVRFLHDAVQVSPDNSLANYNLAIAYASAGDDHQALPYHHRTVELAPHNQDAWINYGKSLSALRRHDEAIGCYDKALDIDPNHVIALGNRGVLLAESGRHEEALSAFRKVLDIDDSHPITWMNKANTLRALKRYEESLDKYDRAIKLDPDNANLWSNKANVLKNMKRYDEALEHYDRAIWLAPDNADAWYNKGYTLTVLKRHDEAVPHYERAIELAPDNADVWYHLGNTLIGFKRYEEAIASFDKALLLDPEYTFLFGDRLSAKLAICDWHELEAELAELARQVDNGQKTCTPFTVLSVLDSPALQQKAAMSYAQNFPHQYFIAPASKTRDNNKIRVGYFTNDFHAHATSFLSAEIFELHDRNAFEIFAFCFGPDKTDKMRNRLVQAFDRFVNVREKSDKESAALSRELGIDIAVDMQGYQTEHRPGIFAFEAAPIQVNYLAYPGTMGAAYMNYLIADHTLIPEASRQYYTEKIAYLPHCYQPNDRKREVADKLYTREAWGLPPRGIVFCCFCSNYKITPCTFDVWMRILKQVKGSVLWLLKENVSAVRNLRQAAEQRGVSGDRLIFAKFADNPHHLARHRVADLFLDTIPCNAHTTASDALWAGLPLLTCKGQSFTSRVAASLLKAAGLPELVTRTLEEYERTAIKLATHPAKLSAIRQKLEADRTTVPLFDSPRYTQHLESAYKAMYERHKSNLPPDHIIVKH